MHRPEWFRDEQVLVSAAVTCGINKDGLDLYMVDASGTRDESLIDDQLAADVAAAREGRTTKTLNYFALEDVRRDWRWVPKYFNTSFDEDFDHSLAFHFPDWTSASIGELMERGQILRRDGHGSPSADQRIGDVPYIKVSDLRAGLVNINPTNMVPRAVAERMWAGPASGLQPFDLLSPERASKNIGDFCMLLPGQEQMVLTREVIVLRVLPLAPFDAFYLHWALGLKMVRQQWDRVIFMQTNREDVGHRFRDIRIPVAPSAEAASLASAPFRAYYQGLAELRGAFGSYLAANGVHHVFVGDHSGGS